MDLIRRIAPVLVCGLGVCGLGACSSPSGSPAVTTAAPPVAPAVARSGVDLAGIDHAIRPGADFFGYANGTWLATAKIPADRSSTGYFLQVFEQAEQRTADLIRNAGKAHPAPGTDSARIADYYTAYMNTAAIEQRGLEPLQPALSAIDAIASRSDLARVLGSRLRADVDPVNNTQFHTEHLFGLFVAQGLSDASHNIGYLLQGGLGLPSRDYYLSHDKAMTADRAKYLTYMTALLKQAGTPDAADAASAVFGLETKIARAQATLLDSQDVHKANNLWNLADFPKKAPGLDWSAYFQAAKLAGQPQLDVWQPAAVARLSALVAREPLMTWKQLLRFHTLDESAALLPKVYADLHFDFYGRTLQGTPAELDRWKRAVAAVNTDLGDAVGQLYVKQYFPPSSKREVQQLVQNLIAAFNQRIDTLQWMTPATRVKAREKLATLHVGVGYPETWRDYRTLGIDAGDALGNHQRAVLHELRYQQAKLGRPIDRAEWWMTPQTVNAVNLPLQNALNFPAAILQPPFFDPTADAAANYGSIGAVIGHEISHSFDNLGSQFDAQGRLANWWTPADAAHFKAAADRLVRQYDQYQVFPGVHVNGQQTLGENIADVAGLVFAYAAYHNSLDGKAAPVIDGLSGDQRFFLAFAQSWRAKTRDAALRERLATDVHAPERFRAQTVRNLDAWYPAYDVLPGQKLYLAPGDRVTIW